MNRTTLVAEGDRLTVRRLDREQPVALLLLDVNDFREVNGTLGHRCGDEVLKLVAERLTDAGPRGRAGGPHRGRRVRAAGASA